jgi:nitrite reductase/ring-hydroxylating ferredoxin subunit
MTDLFAGTVDEFGEGIRVILRDGDVEIGVLKHRNRFHAFANTCAHMGGPVCEGIVVGKVETLVGPDGRETGRRFADEHPHLVCPWHAWEYDLETGECVADRRLRLRRYEVRVDSDRVYVERP